ncbi:MAG: hypothetical protein OEY79_00335 [Anaplasmataceae bacterium]|nr:hypothetical protein [Anaplasmataceae bacterium]
MRYNTKNKNYYTKIIIIGTIKHKIIYQCRQTKNILFEINENKSKIKKTILISNLSEKYNLFSMKSILYPYKNEIIENYIKKNNLNYKINGLIKLNLSNPYNLQYLLTSSSSSEKLEKIINDHKIKNIYLSSCELKKFLNEYYFKYQNKITLIILTETSGLIIFVYINSNIEKKIIDTSYTDNSPSFIAGNIKIEILSLTAKYHDMAIHVYVTNSIKNIFIQYTSLKSPNIKIFSTNESNVLHGTSFDCHDIMFMHGILNKDLSNFSSIEKLKNKNYKNIKIIYNIIYYSTIFIIALSMLIIVI